MCVDYISRCAGRRLQLDDGGFISESRPPGTQLAGLRIGIEQHRDLPFDFDTRLTLTIGLFDSVSLCFGLTMPLRLASLRSISSTVGLNIRS